MVKRIIWSRNAIQDKFLILDYWFKRTGSKTYSKKLHNSFRKSVSYLLKYAEIGRKFDEGDFRFLVKDHYQIFYINL